MKFESEPLTQRYMDPVLKLELLGTKRVVLEPGPKQVTTGYKQNMNTIKET